MLQVKRGGADLTIGVLARATGLAQSAIRYYERLGLIPAPPRRSGWRAYGPADVRRLKLLTAARALGFSLRQLKALGQTLPGAGHWQVRSAPKPPRSTHASTP